MSAWTWVLVVLCAAGVLLAMISSVVVLVAAIGLSRHLSALRESSFVTKLESLEIQVGRLSRLSDGVQDLERRAKTALESLRNTAEASGFDAIRESWRECSSQVRAIVAELS